MNARQRGASWLLFLLLLGRLLDALDLPFEHSALDEAVRPARVEVGREASDQTTTVPAGPAPTTAESAPAPTVMLHINRATAQELQALPGVGPVLAQRIVTFRATHGDFRDAAALRQVQGIGVRLAERLAPLLRFD